jgi:DNA-binding CsgD family transcriptional regulator
VLREAEKLKLPQVPPVSVAIVDRSGRLIGVNKAWKDFGRRYGLQTPNFGVGTNYLSYCECDSSDSLQLVTDLRDLLSGKLTVLTRIYPCHSPTERRWFCMIGLPLSGKSQSGVALLHVDLTSFFAFPKIPCTEQSPAYGAPYSRRLPIDLETVAGSVESSSLEALTSQVAEMLNPGQHPPTQHADEYAGETLDLAGLSKRQLEILGLLAEGKTNMEIAEMLSRSPNTVKLHVSAILRHLHVKSRTQAALLATKLLNPELQE